MVRSFSSERAHFSYLLITLQVHFFVSQRRISYLMSKHPDEPLVEIVGIEEGGRGRSCEIHTVCGSALELDSVVRFRLIHILNDRREEEKAIGVYWVTDGIDRCLVGFLPRHCIKHASYYNGRVAQIVQFLSKDDNPSLRQRSYRKLGMCMAAFLQESEE